MGVFRYPEWEGEGSLELIYTGSVVSEGTSRIDFTFVKVCLCFCEG